MGEASGTKRRANIPAGPEGDGYAEDVSQHLTPVTTSCSAADESVSSGTPPAL